MIPNRPDTTGRIARILLRDDKGHIIGKKPGVWSTFHDSCIDCKKSDSPHRGSGRCGRCYFKHLRATDPTYTTRARLASKKHQLTHEAKPRKVTEQTKAQHRMAAKRYRMKHERYPIGGTVWHEYLAGFWLEGTIVGKKGGRLHVKFASTAEWLAYRYVRLEKPVQVIEREVA